MTADINAQAPAVERIQAGSLHAEIAPEVGGSLTAFYSRRDNGRRHHWMRAATPAALASREPLGMASFPLVPWCNRIRDSRFEFEGQAHRITPNHGNSPHALHGVGWQRSWQMTERTPSAITLRLDYREGAAWPFSFVATQRYELDEQGLSIAMSVENTGSASMPAGIGHHPYFAHRHEGDGTRVQAQVTHIWKGDDEVMPTGLSTDHAAVSGLQRGLRLSEIDLDNNFIGFDREARVQWPDGSALTMSAQAPLDFFVLYCPQGADLFCMEAVSNCTDWINLRALHPESEIGGSVLAPGEQLSGQWRLVPRFV